MRKVVKRPDGTEEVIEGTAEEVAEYERQLREGGKPSLPKKKPVLRGAEVDGKPLTDDEVTLVRLHRLGLLPKEERKADRPVITPMPWPVVMPDQYWLEQPCGFCGQRGCRQLHIWCDTGTTERVSLLVQEDGTTKPSHTLSDILAGKATVEVHTNEDCPRDKAFVVNGNSTWTIDYGMYPKH